MRKLFLIAMLSVSLGAIANYHLSESEIMPQKALSSVSENYKMTDSAEYYNMLRCSEAVLDSCVAEGIMDAEGCEILKGYHQLYFNALTIQSLFELDGFAEIQDSQVYQQYEYNVLRKIDEDYK